MDSARAAFLSLQHPIAEGGVAFTDESGDLWFEEYIVSPPTHILNGFMWTLWGVYDYWLATKEEVAHGLFSRGVQTLLRGLDRYDLGFWSLYEQSGTRLPMVASSFYHRLHIVQLRVMQRLTGESKFAEVADNWEKYTHSTQIGVALLSTKLPSNSATIDAQSPQRKMSAHSLRTFFLRTKGREMAGVALRFGSVLS